MTTKITDKNVSVFANAGVQWQSVVVADGSTALTATAGKGYFIDTTSGTQLINIPSLDDSTIGDTIMFKDFARQWGTNAITLGSNTFDGVTNNPAFTTEGQTVTVVFMGSTKGWSIINEDTTSDIGATFTSATGGTVSTSGNFKIHTFTGDGCFVVSKVGNAGGGGDKVSYLVVAGGGSGGGRYGGGGGGGGFREGKVAPVCSYTVSPLNAPDGLTITATTFPITVGAGGAGVPAVPGSDDGNRGSNSVFSTITSTGGGAGAGQAAQSPLQPGGSGGGGSYASSGPVAAGGAGNTPPVSPPQGSNGGAGHPSCSPYSAGGGGGATEVGVAATESPSASGRGGVGATTHITGSPVGYSGGGGGHGESSHGVTAGAASPCGSGTAGAATNTNSANGAANRGGGSGAAFYPGPSSSSGAGGKGIVVIRYKFQ